MITIEEIASAILNGQALQVRSLVQDWMSGTRHERDASQPASGDARLLAVAASVAELLGERTGDGSPAWTESVRSLAEPLYLVRAAANMPRLRALCEKESPSAFRKRSIFTPPNYLTFA